MKTKSILCYIAFTVFAGICTITYAQAVNAQDSLTLTSDVPALKAGFVRIYNLTGEKISKGHVLTLTDSSIQLKEKPDSIIPVSSIGSIRTKHSAGNNILIGSAIGASVMAIAGAATADPNEWLGWRVGEGIVGGFIVGIAIGAAVGGITIIFKNPKTYLINGDPTKWKAFQSAVTKKD